MSKSRPRARKPARPTSARRRVERHVAAVLDGSIPSNQWIRLAAERWLRDLDRSDLVMDWKEVEAAVEFIEELTLVGSHAGQRWTLLDWQVWFLAGCLGWKYRATGIRRTRLALCQVGRKNGKSTLMSGLALWELLGRRVPGRSVNLIANKLDQARIVLDAAREMAAGRPDAQVLYRSIRSDYGTMTAQTARERSLDGLNPSLWIGDEASEWRGRFVIKLTTATVARDDALGVIISTPGNCPDLVYPEMIQTAEQILQRQSELDTWWPLIYGIDEQDDPADPEVWRKANPSLGAALRLEVLQGQWEQMRSSPIGRTEWLRFHCARPVDSVTKWLDLKHFDAHPDPVEIPEGARVWVGVDTSRSQDMSAVVLAYPSPEGPVYLKGHYWYPAEHAMEREVTYQAPFRRWSEEGHIQLTPGGEIRYEDIRQYLHQLMERYQVQTIAVDPWDTRSFVQGLVSDGLPVALHKQTMDLMGPATQEWQQLWVGGRLRCGGCPVLRMCCNNAHVQTDINGNIRPVKGMSRRLIDALIAAMMAVHAWAIDQGTAPSMYEQGIGVG